MFKRFALAASSAADHRDAPTVDEYGAIIDLSCSPIRHCETEERRSGGVGCTVSGLRARED
jgi:hypothetical protein